MVDLKAEGTATARVFIYRHRRSTVTHCRQHSLLETVYGCLSEQLAWETPRGPVSVSRSSTSHTGHQRNIERPFCNSDCNGFPCNIFIKRKSWIFFWNILQIFQKMNYIQERSWLKVQLTGWSAGRPHKGSTTSKYILTKPLQGYILRKSSSFSQCLIMNCFTPHRTLICKWVSKKNKTEQTENMSSHMFRSGSP